MNKVEKNSPLITVGITSFERPFTLKQTLQSILNQTYKNIEIFICDDFSTTFNIEKSLESFVALNPNLKIITKAKRTGLTESVNSMASMAKGKYFFWMCDDDWIDSNYIEKCVDFLENNSDYILATGTTKFYMNESFVYEPGKINVEDEDKMKRFNSFHNQCLGTANCPDFGLMRLEFLKSTPLKNILGHDNILIGNLAMSGKIKTLENVYIHRRLGGSSETLTKAAVTNSYSTYEKSMPFLALYTNIIADIFTFKSTYKPSGLLNRFYLFSSFTLNLILNFLDKCYIYKKRDTKNINTAEIKEGVLQNKFSNFL